MRNSPSEPSSIDDNMLDRFNGFRFLDKKTKSFLIENARLLEFSTGEVILKAKEAHSTASYYLIGGEVELRHSFDRRVQMAFDDDSNTRALNDCLGQSGQVKALEPCRVVAVAHEVVESSVTTDGYYNVVEFSSVNALLDMEDINSNYQKEWQLEFLKGPLAKNVPAKIVHDLFASLEEVRLKAGDVVVKSKSYGDFFYILKEGEACIKTEAEGSFSGQEFLLGKGQYFGDEALVADTVRNATVVMATDGILGRLDKDSFLRLVKRYLVKEISREGLSLSSAGYLKVIDIRYPIEIPRGESQEGVNIPINKLRKALRDLEQKRTYLVVPASDIRSELAAYLLRQHGLEAYVAKA